jgi:O-methyltransferase
VKFPVVKEMLSRVGVWVSPRTVHYLNGLLNYLNVGRWIHDRGLTVPVRCADRPALYAHVASLVAEPATYLEFGVFQGVTLGMWTVLLKSSDSTFAGFDSFEGLPENWGYFTDKKLFDLKGQMPQFDDPRVRLVKGWFTDTLPGFLKDFQPGPTLIVHLDADLYSSTIFVLRELRSLLRPGTVLIFDEFFDREHELKAFNEFLADEKIRIECLGATRALSQVAFRIQPGST